MQGDNVVCCCFAHAADHLRHWCHFLILGPGEWHQRLVMVLRCHDGGGDRTMVSYWCLWFGVVWGQCWLCLWFDTTYGNNYNDDDNDDNAHGTKNGVNALFHCQPSPPP
eukprot:15186847-Ditylum_brightwellii.AAC.1